MKINYLKIHDCQTNASNEISLPKPIIQTQRGYRRHYCVREPPSFESKSSVIDLTQSGILSSVRHEGVFERVRRIIKEDPSASTRKRCGHVCISWMLLQRIFNCINLFPYNDIWQQFIRQGTQYRFTG